MFPLLSIINVFQLYDKGMTKVWQRYDKGMTKVCKGMQIPGWLHIKPHYICTLA
jgi:hypothetical protein